MSSDLGMLSKKYIDGQSFEVIFLSSLCLIEECDFVQNYHLVHFKMSSLQDLCWHWSLSMLLIKTFVL